MSVLSLIGGIISLIGRALPMALAYFAGLKTRDRQSAEAALEAKNAQAKVAANRPESLSELADRLRRKANDGKPVS